MILSTQSHNLCERFGDDSFVSMLAAAGFDAIDYSMFMLRTDDEHPILTGNYKKIASDLKNVAASCGISFNQAHAPFPSYLESDSKFSESMFFKIQRSIEFASILGAKQICVHPVTFPNNDKRELEFNIDFYNKLAPTAKDFGIKIGVENMFWRDTMSHTIRPGACGTSQKMIEMFDELDPACFTCLLDIGHCGLCGEKPDDFIRALGGKRLGALHVHDNDYKKDLHTLPFTCSVNWGDVASALKDIGYSGEFTLEADEFLNPYPDSFIPQALEFMCRTGRLLISMIEK